MLHRRAAKLGLVRIKQELQAKGLDPRAVTEALAGLQTSERARQRARLFLKALELLLKFSARMLATAKQPQGAALEGRLCE